MLSARSVDRGIYASSADALKQCPNHFETREVSRSEYDATYSCDLVTMVIYYDIFRIAT